MQKAEGLRFMILEEITHSKKKLLHSVYTLSYFLMKSELLQLQSMRWDYLCLALANCRLDWTTVIVQS